MKQSYIQKDRKMIKVQVGLYLIKEDDSYTAFCPELNLSSYGASIDDAKKGFEDAIEIFIEETTRRGTLEKILLQQGWSLQSKPKPVYLPPRFTDKSIINRAEKFFNDRISIPALA